MAVQDAVVADGGSGGFDLTDLASQVPLVLLAVIAIWAFYKEILVAGPTHRNEQKRNDKLAVENAQLRQSLDERVLPALIQSSQIAEKTIRILEVSAQALEANAELNPAVQELKSLVAQVASEVSEQAEASHQLRERVIETLAKWELQ